MNGHKVRRHVLLVDLVAGALTIGTGGFLFARRAFARSALADGMLAQTQPSLAEQRFSELNRLSAHTRDAIADYFHGRCPNVQRLVTHVCSDWFARRSGVRS
jgi:hypothetical protein